MTRDLVCLNLKRAEMMKIWRVFAIRETKWQVHVVRSSLQVFSPTYLPPGLMTMALRLRVSSSTWAMLSLAFWYESSVAQTVILSWMPPKQSSWTLPSLVESREESREGESEKDAEAG